MTSAGRQGKVAQSRFPQLASAILGSSDLRTINLVDKMTIYVGTQLDGCTFELEPLSRQRLKGRRSSDDPLPRSVFIGCDTQQDFVNILGRGELRSMIAEILTGLKPTEVDQVGQIEFVDPGRNFAHFDPATTSGPP